MQLHSTTREISGHCTEHILGPFGLFCHKCFHCGDTIENIRVMPLRLSPNSTGNIQTAHRTTRRTGNMKLDMDMAVSVKYMCLPCLML